MKHALITRPNHDIVTSYLHAFSADVKGDCHLTDLEGKKANRSEVEKVLKSVVTLVLLQGHGTERCVAGHKDEVILDEKNISLTKGMIVYALACDSLRVLGQIAIQSRAKAYIGYREEFMLVIDPTRENTPLKDKNALPFKKVCLVTTESLLAGLTVHDVVKKTKQEYMRQIRSFGTSEDDPYGDAPLIRFALAWNLEFFGMVGEGSAAF